MILLQFEVVELGAQDAVVGADVLDPADAGEDEALLLLIRLDALARLKDERAVGLHVDHFAGDSGSEAVGSVELPLPLEGADAAHFDLWSCGGSEALKSEVVQI